MTCSQLFFDNSINEIYQQTEIVDSFVKVYSNLETLYLSNEDLSDDISIDQDALSSIKFPNLTSLSLRGFRFHDGAFLLKVIVIYFSKISFSKKSNIFTKKKIQVIKQCPKLQRIDLSEADDLEPTMFISNLDIFLPLAEKLRDFR